MTLPYPPELELGLLHPPEGGLRSPIDVRTAVERLIQPSAGGVAIVGRELARPSAGEDDVLDAYRVAVADRLLARRPDLTMDTIRHLETVLAAELAHYDRADRETLDVILETIDGL